MIGEGAAQYIPALERAGKFAGRCNVGWKATNACALTVAVLRDLCQPLREYEGLIENAKSVRFQRTVYAVVVLAMTVGYAIQLAVFWSAQ